MTRPPRKKVRLYYNHRAFRLPLLRRYQAICLGPWILFKGGPDTVSDELLAHELVHQEQIERWGWIVFYSRYVLEYVRNRWRAKTHDEAYRMISFEQEAREGQTDEERYRRNRSRFT